MNFFINVKHLSILITCDEDELIKKLISEFHYFNSPQSTYPQFEIHLYLKDPPQIPELTAHKVLNHALIYQEKGNRYIDYQGRALIHQQGKIYSLYTEDKDFLYELAFLTIHSLLGDLLEKLSLYRIHALAGTYKSRDFILMLPSGGGKSSMLNEFLQDPEFKLISDDSPLIDHLGVIHPFPTKISLNQIPSSGILKDYEWSLFNRSQYSPKHVLSLSHLEDRINPSPKDSAPLLILGQRSSFNEARILEMSTPETLKALLEHMIVGIGLPQVIEIFLSFKFIPDMYKMITSFIKRSSAGLALYRRSNHLKIILSKDIKANCQKIKEFIDENSAR